MKPDPRSTLNRKGFIFYFLILSSVGGFLCTELGVGMTTEGIEVKSVGNTLVLHETALIEAFNLKAAIEYQLKKCEYKLRTK